MYQTEERVDCDIYCTSGEVTKNEQQRDDVVKVVHVPGVDMSVLEGQLPCVSMCKWLVYAVYNWI